MRQRLGEGTCDSPVRGLWTGSALRLQPQRDVLYITRTAGCLSTPTGTPSCQWVCPFFREMMSIMVGQAFLPAIELVSGGHSCPSRTNSNPLGGARMPHSRI